MLTIIAIKTDQKFYMCIEGNATIKQVQNFKHLSDILEMKGGLKWYGYLLRREKDDLQVDTAR